MLNERELLAVVCEYGRELVSLTQPDGTDRDQWKDINEVAERVAMLSREYLRARDAKGRLDATIDANRTQFIYNTAQSARQ